MATLQALLLSRLDSPHPSPPAPHLATVGKNTKGTRITKAQYKNVQSHACAHTHLPCLLSPALFLCSSLFPCLFGFPPAWWQGGRPLHSASCPKQQTLPLHHKLMLCRYTTVCLDYPLQGFIVEPVHEENKAYRYLRQYGKLSGIGLLGTHV